MASIVGTAGADSLIGTEGADSIVGLGGTDTLRGNAGDDRLIGGTGDDRLEGGDGHDWLDGGRGADTLVGGSGNDLYRIDDFDDVVVEEADGGNDRVVIAVDGFKWTPSLLANVEGAVYDAGTAPLALWVDAMVGTNPWGPVGAPATIRYGFLQTSDAPQFSPLGPADRESVRLALGLWAAVTQLTWIEGDPRDADIVFGIADVFPSTADAKTFDRPGSAAKEIYMDDAMVPGGLGISVFWFKSLQHQIGHALGLKHPGGGYADEGDAEPPFMVLYPIHYGTTVMSYVVDPSAQPVSSQLRTYDIAAAQYLYGVNPSVNAGDTVYRASALEWPNNIIADGSGIDTLDASDVPANPPGVASLLDLRSGRPSQYSGLTYNVDLYKPGAFSVGYRTQIENVIGSAGSDRINGNDADNRLDGAAGDDTIDGIRGGDTLLGGVGDDVLMIRPPLDGSAASGFTVIDGGSGHDRLWVYGQRDIGVLGTASELHALYTNTAAGGRFPVLGIAVTGVEQVVFVDEYLQPINVRPLVQSFSLEMDEDTTLSFDLPEALDVEGAALEYSVRLATGGQALPAVSMGRHDVSFTPDRDFNGLALVSYVAWEREDIASYSEPGFVTIRVRPVDDAPVLRKVVSDRSATVGQAFEATVDADTFADVDSPIVYSARLESGAPLPAWLRFDAATRTFEGTPGIDDAGLLRVALGANTDGVGASEVFLLGVHQVPNALPSSRDAEFPVQEDGVLDGRLPEATDADGDALVYEPAVAPAQGRFVFQSDGRFHYAPPADFNGLVSFEYLVNDGRGGASRYRAALTVAAVDDAPTGALTIRAQDATVRAGYSLHAHPDFSDVDGLPEQFTYTWLRDGRPVPAESAARHYLSDADIGARIAVRVNYVDSSGFANALTSAETEPVLGWHTVRGTAAADTLYDSKGADYIDAGDGNDRVVSHYGDDTIDGGDGRDELHALFSFFSPGISIDLASGLARIDERSLQLRSIEVVFGSYGDDTLVGSDSNGQALQESFVPIGGHDTVDGRGGVDAVQIWWPQEQRGELQRSGETMVLQRCVEPADSVTLINIERIRFPDVYLAFGTRAEEVAKVAFALWNPAIASSRYLFARGISYYDVGYGYETLIDAALGFFASDSEQQFAERLAGNVPSGRSAADILVLMREHGGAGAGQAGRAWATQFVADDAANMLNIELAGFISNGIACDLVVDGNLLFAELGA